MEQSCSFLEQPSSYCSSLHLKYFFSPKPCKTTADLPPLLKWAFLSMLFFITYLLSFVLSLIKSQTLLFLPLHYLSWKLQLLHELSDSNDVSSQCPQMQLILTVPLVQDSFCFHLYFPQTCMRKCYCRACPKNSPDLTLQLNFPIINMIYISFYFFFCVAHESTSSASFVLLM